MSRLTAIDPAHAEGPAKTLLNAVQAKLGATPNFIRVLANSPAALEGFLGLYSIADTGRLDHATKERIALAVAEQNACAYCVSAHTAIGRKAGLDSVEILAARRGGSSEKKADAVVSFARSLAMNMGDVSTAEFAAVRAHLNEEEIVEVIAHVALNIFTNIVGKAAQPEIDFPPVTLLNAA